MDGLNTPATATAAIPDAVTGWLTPLLIGLLVLVAIWASLALFGWFQRRAYNLTVMERAQAGRQTPDFLKVDHQTREAALERGDAYADERARGGQPAPPEEPAPPAPPILRKVGRFSRLARIGAVVFAIANLIVVGASALLKAEKTHEFFYSLSNWERWQTLFEKYWIGVTVAVLVILVQAAYLVRTIARDDD